MRQDMSNKIEILNNIKCKSLFSATIPETAEYVAVCRSEQHGFGLLVYFQKTGMYNQINAGVSQSLDQEEVKRALKKANVEQTDEEPLTERILFLAPTSLKKAMLNRIDQIRKPGETAHGAMSNFIREAIILHLARK